MRDDYQLHAYIMGIATHFGKHFKDVTDVVLIEHVRRLVEDHEAHIAGEQIVDGKPECYAEHDLLPTAESSRRLFANTREVAGDGEIVLDIAAEIHAESTQVLVKLRIECIEISTCDELWKVIAMKRGTRTITQLTIRPLRLEASSLFLKTFQLGKRAGTIHLKLLQLTIDLSHTQAILLALVKRLISISYVLRRRPPSQLRIQLGDLTVELFSSCLVPGHTFAKRRQLFSK